MESHLRINRKSSIMLILAFYPATWTQVGCNLLTLSAVNGYLGHKSSPFENWLKNK